MKKILPIVYFVCPICHSSLIINEKIWQCTGEKNDKNRQHCFDVARQGYVNLLPVQQKKSKNPGDSQESILARQRFLQAGFYQPLQQRIAELIQHHLPSSGDWLDIGCGEGYYTQAIAKVDKVEQLIAIDISKPAITELAKMSKQQQMLWLKNRSQKEPQNTSRNESQTIYPLVASASNLPIADDSLNGISSIFSPILPKEMARTLKAQGIVLLAKPNIGHLASVRAGLFDEVREHDSDKFLQELVTAGLQPIHREALSYEFRLNQQQLADLLTMTPYSYRAKAEKRQLLLTKAQETGLTTQACFVLYLLKKVS